MNSIKNFSKNIFNLLFLLIFSFLLSSCLSEYRYYRESGSPVVIEKNNKIGTLIKEKKEKISKEHKFTVQIVIAKIDYNKSIKIKVGNKKNGHDEFIYPSKFSINKIYKNENGFYYNNKFIGTRIKAIDKNNHLYIVSLVPLDNYLSGVLKAEMGNSFPDNALMAQAIVSRTYILEKIENDPEYLFLNSTYHQVYSNDYNSHFLKFVKATEGKVIKYGNNLIKPFFCASNGGIITTPSMVWKSNILFPYYKIKNDYFSKNLPEWEFKIGKYFLRSLFEKHGFNVGGKGVYVANIKLLKRIEDKRVENLIFYFSNGKFLKINGEKFRLIIDPTKIKSTLFSFHYKNNNYIFKGYGYGHGIGFSQIGAKKMAILGYNYTQIIRYYFEGCYIADYKYK